MSHQAVTWAYEQEVKPSGAKFVLVTLANYANGDGYCYPGQASLAKDTGMDPRNVRRSLTVLEEAGLIVRRRRHDKLGRRTSDAYWLIGFKPLPADMSAELEDEMSVSQPDNMSAELPDNMSEPSGHFRQVNRTICPVTIGILRSVSEPSGEPSEGNTQKTDLTEVENYVASCVRSVHGMADVPATEVIGHIVECLANRGQPVDAFTLRRQFQRFRDHYNADRRDVPADEPWWTWRNAVSSWIERIRDGPAEATAARPLYPDWTERAPWEESDD